MKIISYNVHTIFNRKQPMAKILIDIEDDIAALIDKDANENKRSRKGQTAYIVEKYYLDKEQ